MAGIWHFEIDQGDDFERVLVYKKGGYITDLTGCEITLEIQPISSQATIIYDTSDYIDLDSPLGGQFVIRIPDSETIEFRWTKANYRLKITFSDNFTKTILKGTINVNKDF